jgi:dTDP-4-amino-4,6-dideoxygalactose transaminase
MTNKTNLTDLAICGGPPAFGDPVHVGRPNQPDRTQFLQAVNRVLDRNVLTNGGPEMQALEERFRRLTGVEHAIAVSNGTIGLQLVARALNLKGCVLMPAFTFIATAHAFQWLGIEPQFCDVDPATHNLDPAQVAVHLARGGISAVVGVHVWGNLCAPIELEGLCRKHGIPLIFDAAHALGCGTAERAAGAFGLAEVFSLHATKICHSFEGGIITTNDANLAARLARMRNFGFAGYDQVDGLGINAKLPEVSAAMGRLSLDNLDKYRETNRQNAETYRSGLAANPALRIRPEPVNQRSNFQYVVAEISPDCAPGTRNLIYAALHAEGVLVRRYFYPGCHQMEPYRSESSDARTPLPHTDLLCQRILCFPNGTAVSPTEIAIICELTGLIIDHLPDVREQLMQNPVSSRNLAPSVGPVVPELHMPDAPVRFDGSAPQILPPHITVRS